MGDVAKPWYKSKVIMLIVAGILIGIFNKFGALPDFITQDQLAEWLIQYTPFVIAIFARFGSTKEVVTSAAKAEVRNNTIG